jgi:Matrixin
MVAGVLGGVALFSVKSGSVRADSPTDPAFTILVPSENGTWTYVRIDFVMSDRASQADSDTARTGMLSRFPGAVMIDQQGVTAAYVLASFKWTSGSASWSYNASGQPSGLSGASSAIAAAAATWGVAGANFHFVGGGGTGNAATGCSGNADGSNTVGWAPQSAGVLAVTCTRFSSEGEATEFDMQISTTPNWTTGAPPNEDLQSVTTHEFGHALGLQHSPLPQAVMYFAYTQGALKRALDADDIAGELAIYGGVGVAPTPSPTPNPSSTPTATAATSPTATPRPSPTNTPPATPTAPASPSGAPTAVVTAAGSPPTSTPAVPAPDFGNTLALRTGANLMGWPGRTTPPGIALSGEAGSIEIVYGWDADTGTWQHWAPALPSFADTLQFLVQGQAYWFIASSAAQVPFRP